MSYFRRAPRRTLPQRGMSGLGAFTDSDQCSTIPAGDPYRKPGNYCATPDGGTTTFNADGSTYRAPGAVDPDPAHPAGASSGGSFWDTLTAAITRPAVPTYPGMPVASTGMSTTTMLMLGGAAVAVAVLLARR